MEIVLGVVALLLLSIISVAVGEKLGLPWPALLSVVAMVIVFIPGIPALHVPADLILPIFLPPLLWALARRTSWGVIRQQWLTIVSLSVLLVVVTTAAVGAAAYVFLPGVGVAAALLIGAAIAPPDPVAVDAVAEPAGIPRRIISALQTEGLFNDAASIVVFHMALLAVTRGAELSVGEGILKFAYSAAVASVIGLLVGRVASWFIKHVHDVTARNALTWVIPFATYILSEELGASGVIAVVIAAVELNSRAPIEAEDRVSGQAFWSTVDLLFTGLAFGLIGLSVNDAITQVGSDLWHSVLVGVILSLVAFAVRLAWMYVFYRINLRRGKPGVAPLRLQEVLLMTWSGMRGLVTLALVLSVPSGAIPFYNELAVIALTVLLVTMVLPGMLLPWLMGKLDLTADSQAASDKMHAEVTERARKAAIDSLRKQHDDLEPEVAANIDDWFDKVFGTDDLDAEDQKARLEKVHRARAFAAQARATAFQASQSVLLEMRNDPRYNPALVDEVLHEVDRMVLAARK